MRYFLFYLIIFFSIVLQSCKTDKKENFSDIKLFRWYSGVVDDKEIFMMFSSSNANAAEGLAFTNKNESVVSLQDLTINSKSLEIKSDSGSVSIKGRWKINDSDLVFTQKKKEQSVFKLQPQYKIPYFKERYIKNIFESVQRSEEVYGKAQGFYKSKKVAEMGLSAYPSIIMGVFNELKKNPMTTELSLDMDIYEPKGDTNSYRPVLVLLHAGAFIVGDKREKFQEKLATHFAKSGYVVASINYRLGYMFIPGMYSNLERCMYKAVQDTRAAIRWLVHNKSKYKIDSNNIFLCGNSAGGFISLITAFMDENEVFESAKGNVFLLQDDLGCLDCSGNSIKEKFKIKGVINLWGAITDLELISNSDKTPMLLIHGDSDKIVPYGYGYPFRNIYEKLSAIFSKKVYGSKEIFNKAIEENLYAKLVTIKNGSHEPYMDDNNVFTKEYDGIRNTIDTFIYSQIKPEKIVVKKQNINEYKISNVNEDSKIFIEINGGCITSYKDNIAKITRFKNSDKCIFKVAVLNKIGILSESEMEIN